MADDGSVFRDIMNRLLMGEFDEDEDDIEDARSVNSMDFPLDVGMDWEECDEYPTEGGRSVNLLQGGNFKSFVCQRLTGDSLLLYTKNTLFKMPLYKDSDCTLEDFSKGLLFLRQKYQRLMGDDLMAGIAGFVGSILPPSNALHAYISKCGSSNSKYFWTKMIFESSGLAGCTVLGTAEVDVCINGCFPFCGESNDIFRCPKCHVMRYEECGPSCLRGGVLVCGRLHPEPHLKHARTARRRMYYCAIRDRIQCLVDGDLRRLLSYPWDRRKPMEGYVDDIYDGTSWKTFEDLLSPGEELLGIQACTDGADMFNYSGKSMWPLAWSILNFPPNLRDKMHLGMHLASFDTGSDAALILFARELLDMWRNPIQQSVAPFKKYKLALLQILADGPGLCKITHTTGASAHHGCNLCNFSGEPYAGGTYCFAYRRYLPLTHPLRKRRQLHGLQFDSNEDRSIPVLRSYDTFHADGIEADRKRAIILASRGGSIKKANVVVVNGVKGVWAFDMLPYAKHIVWEKDSMHAFYNAISDALNVLSPTSKSGYRKHENRTEKTTVRAECK
jgi:hypothetical protein